LRRPTAQIGLQSLGPLDYVEVLAYKLCLWITEVDFVNQFRRNI